MERAAAKGRISSLQPGQRRRHGESEASSKPEDRGRRGGPAGHERRGGSSTKTSSIVRRRFGHSRADPVDTSEIQSINISAYSRLGSGSGFKRMLWVFG